MNAAKWGWNLGTGFLHVPCQALYYMFLVDNISEYDPYASVVDIGGVQSNDLYEMRNFRLIPYSTINGSGTLPAFMADEIKIHLNSKISDVKNIYIAVTDKKIISGGFSALIGTPFFDLTDNLTKQPYSERKIRNE